MTYWKHNMLKCENVIIITNSLATPWNIYTVSFRPHNTNLKNEEITYPLDIIQRVAQIKR